MLRRKVFYKVYDNVARRKIEGRSPNWRRLVTIWSFNEYLRLPKASVNGFYNLLPSADRHKQSLRKNFHDRFGARGKTFLDDLRKTIKLSNMASMSYLAKS
jgi:hypothetical protein